MPYDFIGVARSVLIGSGNLLSSSRGQAIIWNTAKLGLDPLKFIYMNVTDRVQQYVYTFRGRWFKNSWWCNRIGLLSFGPLGINFTENIVKIKNFFFSFQLTSNDSFWLKCFVAIWTSHGNGEFKLQLLTATVVSERQFCRIRFIVHPVFSKLEIREFNQMIWAFYSWQSYWFHVRINEVKIWHNGGLQMQILDETNENTWCAEYRKMLNIILAPHCAVEQKRSSPNLFISQFVVH